MILGGRELAAVLVVLAAGSCGPRQILSYEDLVTSGRLGTLVGAGPADEATCADETRFAIALDPGTEVRLQVELGARPRLGLSACLAAPEGSEPGDAALTLDVLGSAGRGTSWTLPVGGGAWAARTTDLEAFAEGPLEIRLAVRAPAGTAVLVNDFYVRHEVPRGAEVPEPRGAGPRRAEGPSVLLISLDTLRADAVGPGTPELAAFAAQAETWKPHYASASWTKPSHASLLTGYPPEVHGAALEPDAIHPAVPTLAERFRAAGYRTAGLAYDCEWLDAKWGFDRGFDEYRVVRWGADQAARATAGWIAAHPDQPFFYFLHLFTPHSDRAVLPYEATGVDRTTVAERFGIEDYGCRRGSCASQLLLRLNDDLEPLPEEERVLRFLYGEGVATTDAAIGRLLRDLERMGVLEEMLVVVTSDHGEAFFEHGKVLHSTVHREVIEVPLLIHWPRGRHAGERRDTPSSAIDLAPTLLAAAGVPARDLPGTPLHERTPRQPVFSGAITNSVVVGNAHALFDVRTGEGELYHLGRDPAEQDDLAALHPEQLLRLRDRVVDWIQEARRLRESLLAGTGAAPVPEVELTEEERRRLESLGYVQ